jgi:channel protein (hemolysin III family)
MSIRAIPGFAEPFSSLLHLSGAAVFFVLAFFLLARGWGSAGRVFALAVFAFSVVFLLSMSGVYHLLAEGGAGRRVLQRLDHAGIFLLIAGSFTPLHGLLFTGFWRWGFLALIGTLAAVGIVLSVVFFDSIPEWMSLSFYLGMGWLGLVSGVLLSRRFGVSFIKPLLLSAFSYTLGGVAEFLRWPVLIPGVVESHELFHVAVIAGIGFHWYFVYCCLAKHREAL